MHVAVTMIIGGHASINTNGGESSGAVGRTSFCGLIRADGKHCRWPGVSSDPSPKGLGNVFGISKERPIAIIGANVDADLITEV